MTARKGAAAYDNEVPRARFNAPRCKFCGSDRFREYGRVECSGSRESRSVGRDALGKLKIEWGFVDAEDFDAELEPDGVECRNCGADAAKVEDLVDGRFGFEPGERVVCPDGFKAIVAAVDLEAGRLTVEGWHEEFKFAEVSALVPAA